MIPLPWWWKWAGVGLLLAAVGGWGIYQMIRADVADGKLSSCRGRLAEFEGAYNALAGSARRQNEAIGALQDAAAAREDRARRDVAVARTAAAKQRAQADALVGLTPPAGTDECSAARYAFDAELREERGK